MKILALLFFTCLSFGCVNRHPAKIVELDNPAFSPNTAFTSFEDYQSPKVKAFKDRFQLDTVFHGETNEDKRILLLRNWIKEHIKISDFEENYPGEGYAEKIIDTALKGHGFHCGHYMIVQNAVMNAYGYVTRCIGAGPGVKGGPDWHHGSNEIWSNTYHKWYVSDAKYNHQFEKNGIPLSALEVRAAFLKNGAADIELIKGPGRTQIAGDSLKNASGKYIFKTKKEFAQAYTWIEFEKQNDRFTNWPENSDNLNIFNLYLDDYSGQNTWIWDGKPHWAYNTKFMVPVADSNAIEWTPNTVKVSAIIDNESIVIKLLSSTPNFSSYQMKDVQVGKWTAVPDSIRLPIEKDRYDLIFRSVNQANVSGPESKLTVSK